MQVNFESLTGRQDWIDFLVDVACAYRARFERSLPIPGELGELIACTRLGLRPAPLGTAAYDASDDQGKKVQIKTRAPAPNKLQASSSGRVGRFGSFNFDYALLVVLNYDYSLKDIWRAKSADLQGIQNNVKNPRAGMSLSAFKKVAQKMQVP